MANDEHKLVPNHTGGIQKNLKHDLVLDSLDDAEELFVIAKDRLLNVNRWQQTASSVSAEFQLTDKYGQEMSRPAHSNDLIRIKIAAPGSASGDGYDWVLVEAIEYDDYPDEEYETFAMRVRPTPNPADNSEEIAHFFTDAATSTFVIERRGRHVIAHYFGRNEKANTEADPGDAARNVAVSVGAWLMGSDIQWLSLIKGFLDTRRLDME
jgi:hypothetical protein